MNIEGSAKWYLQHGFSVFPAQGKKPAVGVWQTYQTRLAKPDEFNWQGQNIALVCGKVSGNLVVMDLDSPLAVEMFSSAFPTLLDTYTVISGSGKGLHLYYRAESLPATTRVMLPGEHSAIELRANGMYVLAPPSIHPETGAQYRRADQAPTKILRLPHMEDVRAWLHSLIRAKYEQQPALTPYKPLPAVKTGQWIPREEFMRAMYLKRAIERETHQISTASIGYRNSRLFKGAIVLGQLVAGGELSAAEVESALLSAAVAVGLPEDASRRTIASGFKHGERNPRYVPDAPPVKD